MERTSGFLIVLAADEPEVSRSPRNPRYLGIDRVPAYPSAQPEEAAAIDAYVFGEYKDEDSGLIPDFRAARELLELFSSSPRHFEILRLTELRAPEDALAPQYRLLGFDASGRNGDFWSITGDFPEEGAMSSYRQLLNQNGLFGDPETAFRFRDDYVARQLDDYFVGLIVYQVEAVDLSVSPPR